jgi:hypothetical protein
MTLDHQDTDAFRAATFRRVDLAGASFREVDLSGATVRDSDVRGLRIVASSVDDVVINGHEGVGRVVVDDVEVTAFVRAELDRRNPERVLIREMRSLDEVRAAWAVVGQKWDDALTHAATLPEPLLDQRVEGEWSFVETMRHLVFAVDIWVGRMLSDTPGAFHPLGLPPTDTTDDAAAEMGLTRGATPSFAEVEALHRWARGRFDATLARLTDADLPTVRTAVLAPDWGEETFPVSECLVVVVTEHAEHLRFARRDLAVLEAPREPSAPA